MRRNLPLCVCLLAIVGLFVPYAMAQGTSAVEPTTPPEVDRSVEPAIEPAATPMDDLIANVTKPVDWLEWGADFRLRQAYLKNATDLSHTFNDNRHYFRIRSRVWARVGPFLQDDQLELENGVSVYARLAHEFYIWAQRPNRPVTPEVTIDEVFLDNAYIDVQRIFALPLSVRFGRQDLVYGKGWIIADGTPLDDSRSIHSDALKATLHLDDADASIDFFMIHNKGDQTRARPWNERSRIVSEYDADVVGLYLKSHPFRDGEAHAYYIYKDDDLTDVPSAPVLPLRNGRIVHTLGGLLMGECAEDVDYYVEAAMQWGREGSVKRSGYGFNSDFGYTFPGIEWKPRVHAGYEYLSGDRGDTGKYEGWDPVLSRRPFPSELYYYTYIGEGGLQGMWSNLHRLTTGVHLTPSEKMKIHLDYSLLAAPEHPFGRAAPFSGDHDRGQLVQGKLMYEFNKYISGNLLAEYFHPEGYYDDITDNALMLRWELTLKF